jgi:hypothetical protein
VKKVEAKVVIPARVAETKVTKLKVALERGEITKTKFVQVRNVIRSRVIISRKTFEKRAAVLRTRVI